MLSIALCDDQPEELALIAGYAAEYVRSTRREAAIRQFPHPDALLGACGKERFHLYVLDIVMPMMDGIEVGKAIRRLDREAQILYATTEPGFALRSFAAHPVDYLLKPIDKRRFFDALSLAISRLELEDERAMVVKTREGLRVLRLSEIACCEYVRHTAVYSLTNGETIASRTIAGPFTQYVEPLLRDARFLRPHVSFVMNMAHVELFSKDRFTMRGGAAVPIAAKQYGAARDAYMDFLLNGRPR